VAKRIVYGNHAEEKFEILKQHGFVASKKQVKETLRRPDRIEEGFRGRKIAQRRISEHHVLRVVYVEGRTGDGCRDFLSGEKKPL
jgi:hypothetical protein